MFRRRAFRCVRRVLAAAVITVGVVTSAAGTGGASTSASAATLVSDPASLVNPFIGTSGGVNEFPGPDMPFGMMQWGPDTFPDRADGGGYTYGDSQISGYSLTHLSGPGCAAYGDVPILPTVGAIGSSPGSATDKVAHAAETARIGYYADTLGNGVGVRLTDTTRAGIGIFTFPATTQANLLLKLSDSADFVGATAYQIVSDTEVEGQVTAGGFCQNPWETGYTLHFDIVFSQPFTSSSAWTGTNIAGSSIPGGVALTFNTTADQTVTAKVGTSFTSDANAVANLRAEIPGWDFTRVRDANVAAWNAMLGKIRVAGGSVQQQTDFYTALYHALLYPSVFSDDNGQYTGANGKTYTVQPGHAEYANFSGWDIYRGQVQLASILAPAQTSDAITSLLDDYAQVGELPKWSLANSETYVQVGDSADPIIADAYAFGARGFDVQQALTDMIAQATSNNTERSGQATLDTYGYLPFDTTYSCCDFNGVVSTQLEYDTDDYAIASLAQATGDMADYEMFATRAQNWQNSFNIDTGYIQPRVTDGTWLSDFSPSQFAGYVQGTSSQYTAMVPFNLGTLIAARGGNAAWVNYLNSLLANITNPGPTNAILGNEPSLDIPYEYDYAGAPYLTQRAVRNIEQELYTDTPAGEPGNDDLGAMSSTYVWDELGFYPETPGTPVLALGSPAFPRISVSLPGGQKLVINAPDARPDAPYVTGLTVNGQTWQKAYLDYDSLSDGATLDYQLSASPDTRWAAASADAPPSDDHGGQPALTSAGSPSGPILKPGASGAATFSVKNLTGKAMTVDWTASPQAGVTVSPASGTLSVPADSRAQAPLTVTAGATAQAGSSYPITFTATTTAGARLESSTLAVDVANTGDIWPDYNNIGVASGGQYVSDGFLGGIYTYSSTGLAADGITPGASITADGVHYTWPSQAAGQPDSIESDGQVIPVSLPAGSTTIGLLGGAIATSSAGASGTLAITYTDGTTQHARVAFSDITLGFGAYAPLPSDTIVASMPYFAAVGIHVPYPAYLYSVSVPLEAGKTVASVTLPVTSSLEGQIGIFAIGAG
jgi:predicted alpha-1,2-mannosidase